MFKLTLQKTSRCHFLVSSNFQNRLHTRHNVASALLCKFIVFCSSFLILDSTKYVPPAITYFKYFLQITIRKRARLHTKKNREEKKENREKQQPHKFITPNLTPNPIQKLKALCAEEPVFFCQPPSKASTSLAFPRGHLGGVHRHVHFSFLIPIYDGFHWGCSDPRLLLSRPAPL